VQCFNGIKTRVRKEVGEVETDTEKRKEILGMQRRDIGDEDTHEVFL